MKTLSRWKLFDYLKAWMYVRCFTPPPRVYDKNVLDKAFFIGKSIEQLLKIFPDAHVKSAFESRPDAMYAEVRKNSGTVLIVFEKGVCVQVEYFSDKEDGVE